MVLGRTVKCVVRDCEVKWCRAGQQSVLGRTIKCVGQNCVVCWEGQRGGVLYDSEVCWVVLCSVLDRTVKCVG